MDWKQHVSVAALLVSIGSCALSYDLSKRTAATSVRPVLVFQDNGKKGWSVRNVGNGAALDVLVAMKVDDKAPWTEPMRIPPLPREGEFYLTKWPVYAAAKTLGATYIDVESRRYSTTCTNDLSSIENGNAVGTWPDKEIKRHWH